MARSCQPPAGPPQPSDDVAGWGAMLADALWQTGGALSDDVGRPGAGTAGRRQAAGGMAASSARAQSR
jgi:hypothetical protein